MATNNLQILKKGKRPAPSTNSEDEDEIYNDVEIRVGSNYQADIPELLSQPESKHKERPKSLLVWFPPKNISEVELNDYILFSKNKYGYNTEQCLGLLYWNKHNLEKSIHDLPMYSPYSNWSILDKSNFESAFNKIGKNFVQIAKMLPDKSLKSIIGYYYLWKKKKTGRCSVKSSNKLEHFCVNKIQIGSGGKPSSTKSKPVNMSSSYLYQTQKGPMCKKCSKLGTNESIRPILRPPCSSNFHFNFICDKRSLPQD